jgi:hypothetical protein
MSDELRDRAERFMGNPEPAQCNYCRHFHFATEGPVSCAAFPDGIPDVILDNELDHRLEVSGRSRHTVRTKEPG